jgi:hypothetical protein
MDLYETCIDLFEAIFQRQEFLLLSEKRRFDYDWPLFERVWCSTVA